MAANPNWPLVVDQVAFVGDPNDPNSVASYTDITARVRTFESARGRQYEIDQNQTGEAHLTVSDKDEYLNPANTSAPAPFNGNIKPYRRYLRQAMWPPAPVGGAVNLLNASAIPTGYDPTFESYTAGTTPSWVTALGGISPTVQATNPQQGTKSLQWTVAATSTQQGVSVTVPCIPGRQYTASGYVRQSTASTQQISVGGATVAADTFARTVSGGWGTPDIGQAWVNDGTSAQFNVSGGTGNHVVNATGTKFRSRLSGPAVADVDLRFLVTCATAPTGSFVGTDAVVRFVDASNHYTGWIQRYPGGSIDVGVSRWSAGTETVLAVAPAALTNNPAVPIGMRLKVVGTTLQFKVWRADADEPTAWLLTATDTAFTSGTVGVASYLAPANTNALPVTVSYGSLTAVGALLGTSTTTSGAYTRLTTTFTATQPFHTVQFATVGTATAGTVNLDAIQHEPGATASAFAASGPAIYTPFAGYVERWPASWNHQGTYGMCTLACVDAMATLAGTDLHAEYRGAVLAKKPDYYWPLGESSTATTFGDASGNSGPSLIQNVSKYGAGTAPAGGTTMNIAGDPSGTGVKFTPANPTSANQAATILGVGPLVGNTPSLLLPAAIGTSWAITASTWVQVSSSTETSQVALRAATPIAASASGLAAFVPIQLDLQNTANTIAFQNVAAGASYIVTQGSSVTIADGKLHHVVGVVAQDSTNTTLTVYVDGTATGTKTVATSSVGGMLAAQSTNLFVGGYDDSSWFEFITNGSMAHLAMWNRALSSSEVADLYAAGKGYAGETSGQRIARLLSIGGYTGPTAIDTGQSVMGASTITEGAALLDACQQVTLSENGNLYVEAGTVTAKSRTDRYLKLTSTWVFGENAAGGEYPYEADIAYDYDPTRVANDIKVSRTGGITATASDPNVSQKQYFRRSYQRTIGVASDNETIDAANYLLSRGKQPIQRISRLAIKPSANPALWPVALGVRIGDRVTVKRRTAAFTMSNDYFVEKVEHQNEPGSWVTSLQMSPVDASTVWILGDATYGQLGITTILGY